MILTQGRRTGILTPDGSTGLPAGGPEESISETSRACGVPPYRLGMLQVGPLVRSFCFGSISPDLLSEPQRENVMGLGVNEILLVIAASIVSIVVARRRDRRWIA